MLAILATAAVRVTKEQDRSEVSAYEDQPTADQGEKRLEGHWKMSSSGETIFYLTLLFKPILKEWWSAQ